MHTSFHFASNYVYVKTFQFLIYIFCCPLKFFTKSYLMLAGLWERSKTILSISILHLYSGFSLRYFMLTKSYLNSLFLENIWILLVLFYAFGREFLKTKLKLKKKCIQVITWRWIDDVTTILRANKWSKRVFSSNFFSLLFAYLDLYFVWATQPSSKIVFIQSFFFCIFVFVFPFCLVFFSFR